MSKSKLFLCLFGALFPVLIFAQEDNQAISVPPYFKGCEDLPDSSQEKKTCSDKALMRFIANGLQYPPIALENNIQGTVVVSFDIDETGRIASTKIESDIGAGCGEAAVKIVESMPLWTPAREQSKPIRTRMTLPVRFSFGEQSTNPAEAYSLIWGECRTGKIAKKDLKSTLNEVVMVRDPFGNAVAISDLLVTYEKGRKSATARSKNNKLTKTSTTVNHSIFFFASSIFLQVRFFCIKS